jgi:hypothetical protein
MIKKEKNKTHNFHFVLNKELKSKIKDLSYRLNKSLSKTIIYILKITVHILDKYQYNIEEATEISKYPTVNWDVDTNVHIDKILFRKIKHIQGTMHAYSISVIVRKLLELYFHFLKLSNKRIERVERIFKRFYSLYIKKIGTKIMKINKNKEIMPQLYGKFLYSLTFNDKYYLTEITFHKSD